MSITKGMVWAAEHNKGYRGISNYDIRRHVQDQKQNARNLKTQRKLEKKYKKDLNKQSKHVKKMASKSINKSLGKKISRARGSKK